MIKTFLANSTIYGVILSDKPKSMLFDMFERDFMSIKYSLFLVSEIKRTRKPKEPAPVVKEIPKPEPRLENDVTKQLEEKKFEKMSRDLG